MDNNNQNNQRSGAASSRQSNNQPNPRTQRSNNDPSSRQPYPNQQPPPYPGYGAQGGLHHNQPYSAPHLAPPNGGPPQPGPHPARGEQPRYFNPNQNQLQKNPSIAPTGHHHPYSNPQQFPPGQPMMYSQRPPPGQGMQPSLVQTASIPPQQNVVAPLQNQPPRGNQIRGPPQQQPFQALGQNQPQNQRSTTRGQQQQMVNPTPGRNQRQNTQNQIAEHSEPKLQNLVSTASLDVQLDLKEIAQKCRNAEFNPKRFAAVIMRRKDPRTTALIFKTGKMVITGAKSKELSLKAAREYANDIKKIGNKAVRLTDFKVQNMVGSCSVSYQIKLEALFSDGKYKNFCHYNPETFPGLIFHLVSPKICLLIFKSGKIVLTGAKSVEDINKAFDAIQPVLQKFKRVD